MATAKTQNAAPTDQDFERIAWRMFRYLVIPVAILFATMISVKMINEIVPAVREWVTVERTIYVENGVTWYYGDGRYEAYGTSRVPVTRAESIDDATLVPLVTCPNGGTCQ